jgi:hypothetical protein
MNSNISELIYVLITFAIGFLLIIWTLRTVAKMKLRIFQSLVLTSLGFGFAFGVMAFMFTYANSNVELPFITRLSISGEIFIWGFFGVLIVSPIAAYIAKRSKKSR